MIRTVAVSAVLVVAVGAAVFFLNKETPGHYRYRTILQLELPKELSKLEARVKLTPTDSFALNELAQRYVYEAQVSGDVSWYAKAEKLARTSIAILPSPNPAKLIVAQALEARHDFDQAIEWADKAMQDRPSAGPLQVITTSYLAKGDYLNANRYADGLVEQKPSAETLLTRALVRSAQGREEEALYDFKRASELEDFGDPHGAARLRALWGRTLTARSDFSNAEALLIESLRIVPSNHLALSELGELEIARGNYAAAQKYLTEAFSSSKQIRYLIHFARAKSLAGNRAGAEEVWGEAERLTRTDLQDSHFGHRLDLIQLLVDRGRPADLEEAANLSGEEIKIRKTPETLFYQAKALARLRQWPAAGKAMSDCLSLGGKSAEMYELQGEVQQSTGYLSHAFFYYQLAQKRNPRLERVNTRLAALERAPKVMTGGLEVR